LPDDFLKTKGLFVFADLNHEENARIIPELVDRTLRMGASNYRLLKLLCRRLFDASTYKNLVRIGSGAYGQVYRAYLASEKVSFFPVSLQLEPYPADLS